MIIYDSPAPATHVPVIDIAGADSPDMNVRDRIAREIHIACRTIGFFYITGHDVAEESVARAFDASKRFFDLPLEEKMAVHMRLSPGQSGYEPIAAQVLDSQDADSEAAPPDLKESFYCGLDLPADHPLSLKKLRGYGHNQWPASFPQMSAPLITYYGEMKLLGDRLLRMIARSLELDEGWFQPYFQPPAATLRLIKYPPQPPGAAFNQIGAGAHTDWGSITILAQDSAGGLEVRTIEGEWIDAPPVPGAFVINLGDLMARWTNGLYSSNMHRVKNNRSGGDRYSLPFFMSPQPDAVIAPVPGSVSEERPQLFPVCTSADHLNEMFRRSYGYSPAAPA
ncbi:MAG: isopenicillin N synthase family oxygenase [Beijerinckiaceae bacterium]|nr:isopenicillin N synthase family oxygenase [Beijerinckiaceae bacterium]